MTANYILSIEGNITYDPQSLKKKLDLAIDWMQVMPDVYILHTTSDASKWYARLKPVLGKGRFFIIKVDLSNYSGWLAKSKWNWLKDKK
ncbi:hypothetical protein [Candidatus Avelusimicrobium fimicolum]|uniref:hypothetical protein n=1 Tax=Candidatus Avelusimicrobium fimicolum TaxID=3416216 RepID=UPI003D0A99FB